MTVFPPSVQAHVTANAPTISSGVVDYNRLLLDDLNQLDMYNSREHVRTLSGQQLAHDIRIRAQALSELGLRRGSRVLLLSVNDEKYLATLLAVLLLGAIPCAIAPPATPTDSDSAAVQHVCAAIQAVDPQLVLTQSRNAMVVSHIQVATYDSLNHAQPISVPPQSTAIPSDVHHIQLTSGSTSAPKAVLLTHENVAQNIAAIGYATSVVRGQGKTFSWLPLYHDMGFIQILCGLVYGVPVGLMAPLSFLRDPLSWVRHMSAHRSTYTAGPPFAYRLAADALSRAHADLTIDLSALKYAYVGAEPIPYSTLRQFTDAFRSHGLNDDALVPCYGMAESVLATTLAVNPSAPGPDSFGRVRTLRVEGTQLPLMSCGPALPGINLRVVDSEGTDLPDGSPGEIQISGPSIMLGYRNADGSVTRPANGWHHTGDRGLLSDGELFVVGRTKELLIVRGRNFPPYDVERRIDDMADVGPGRAVVFSIPDQGQGRESVIAVVGSDHAAAQHHRICTDIAAMVRNAFGFSLDHIALVPSSSIPRTTSGKLQRMKTRDLYMAGQLELSLP